jgi:hypothetical protein
MLAGALCRLAVDAPRASPHDMPLLARTLRRTLLARNAAQLPHVRALSRAFASTLNARRSYATTTRAAKPTPTVKKAVKTAAAKKPAPKKATPAKKAAPKKAASKKAVAKKAAPKKKAKKAAAKKPAPKKRVKRALTPEEQQKAKLRELRVKALREPVSHNLINARHVFVAEKFAGKEANHAKAMASVQAEFKNLTTAELEVSPNRLAMQCCCTNYLKHYNHLANERNAARRAEYQAWINTYTPDQIRIANNARARLRRMAADANKKAPAHSARLVDDRQPKGSVNSYSAFVRDRFASGDFKGISVPESSKLMSQEWKALSAGEKKVRSNNTSQRLALTCLQKYEDEHVAAKSAA